MPRVGESRVPAEPSSAGQKARYRRILRAAARLGARDDLERVQMQDVAREAGVAIATPASRATSCICTRSRSSRAPSLAAARRIRR